MSAAVVDLFRYQDAEVRVVVIDDEPWFVAADVASILDYRMASDMTRSLDPLDRGTRLMRTPSGPQDMAVISEGGLFQCIVQRQTGRMTDDTTREQVRAFQRWVTHEVLPAIRKTGAYGAPTGLTFEEMTAHVIAELNARIEAAHARAKELESPAAAWQGLASSEGDYTITDAAKVLARGGVATGQRKLYDWLDVHKWIFRRGGRWQAMQSAVNSGYLVERVTSYMDERTGERLLGDPQIRVTAKGLERLRDVMASQALEVVP